MKALLVIMTGIGFTLGVVFGLLLHLPSDSLPAQQQQRQHNDVIQNDVRAKRHAPVAPNDLTGNFDIKSFDPSTSGGKDVVFGQTINGAGHRSLQISDSDLQPDLRLSAHKPRANNEHLTRKLKVNNPENARSWKKADQQRSSLSFSKQTARGQDKDLSDSVRTESHGAPSNPVFIQGLETEGKSGETRGLNPSLVHSSSSAFKGVGSERSNNSWNSTIGGERNSTNGSVSLEDRLYMSSIIHDHVYWSEKAENMCRKPFTATDIDSWRDKVQGLDVVKMETGCGRMQNRLLTFRDSSKACARYRLNTDQIQGDIFSYYLAKLLNIPNLPPTVLASVNSVDQKWRTVHLDLSLAQWADSKLVVLTKFIDGLKPAHIPKEFRDERRKLYPILDHLGSKSQTGLCELMQWSDLIVFDYLTANLDRVINNMFNSQWNDQMMASPTHNLEQFSDGGLVFLDNESGLFHGFRLIDKYEKLHRSLLDSVCVFRSSTADVIKRLVTSGSVGKELRHLLESNESLARFVPSMPGKNVKILERRLQQVYKQIVKCEKQFHTNSR